MNRRLIVALLVVTIPFLANAQLRGLMNKIKNKVGQKINGTVDQQIDKTLDEPQSGRSNNENTSPNLSMAHT